MMVEFFLSCFTILLIDKSFLEFVGQVLDVKFSGDRVVTCGVDGVICIWDGWTGCCVMVFRGHLDSVTSISLRQTPGLNNFLI